LTRTSLDLADWYPLVVATGVVTPKTHIVRTDLDLSLLLDGKTPDGFDEFLVELARAADQVGWPMFLRTGYGSGKHDYVDTCLVNGPDDLGQHVFNLVEWSWMVDFPHLPTRTWVARELLPVEAPFTAYNGMPVAKERRYFVNDGKVIGHHPYWPPEAIEAGHPHSFAGESMSSVEWRPMLDSLNEESPAEVADLTEQTQWVGAALAGAWSVDWLWVPDRGWVCIDLAHMERSFIWVEHPNAPTLSI
jgi:hypothetical protein